jgi:two-component system, OmpR family, phosphate regulon sensor histidine kinase PhoR
MDLASLLVLTGLSVALLAALVALRRRSAELDALVEAEVGVPLDAATAGLPSGQSPGTARPARTDAHAPLVPDGLDDLLPAGIVRFGADGRVAGANARAAVLLGVAATRLVGRTVMEAFLDTRIEAFIDGGSGAVEVRLGDGEPRTVILRVARTAGGGTVVILEDVSELRRLQRIRSELIDNLSHELRTPLTTIGLLAETATREAASDDVPERLRDRIAKIEVETGHLVQMVAEILDLARIEGGSRIVPEDDVDLGRLAESSAERLRLFAERQGVTLSVDAAPGSPTIRADEARLGQVFVNLVHNAVKFSPDGGEVRITVRPEREGDGVRAEVTDHGIGIEKADRERVFERFYKVDRARARGGGTGLGLAIARHIVAAHGGRIGVDSEPGRGSTFWFVLPLRPPVAAAEPERLATPDAAGAPGA